MHWNHDAGLVGLTHVDGMAAALPAKYEAQSFGHADHVSCRSGGLFRRHAGISIGLMKMSSVGTGKPTSRKLST